MSSTRTLVFQTITRSDTETYMCIASNSAGLETKSSLMIDVQCKLLLCPVVVINVCRNELNICKY